MSGASKLNPRAPLWILASVTFSGTLAMHIFVPALPLAARDLAASSSSLQLTISIYILGLAIGQLLYGPLSDRFGRRPVLLVGLLLYSVAGLVAALAPDVRILVVARLFQAIGGCSGLVLGRAIVRDGVGVDEATRRLAVVSLIVNVGPGLAPLAGAELGAWLGWRSIFFALTAMGLINFLITWRLLPETGPQRSTHRDARRTGELWSNFRQLITSRAFLGYAIGGGCATTSMYAFISAAPFIFTEQLRQPSRDVGIYLAIIVGALWVGSVVASRIAGRVAVNRQMIGGNLMSVAGAFIFLGAVLFGVLSVPITVGSMIMFMFGVGVSSPPALAEAMSVNPKVIGSASGVYGFMQMTVGAICSSAASLGSTPALGSAVVLVVAGALAQFSFWTAIRSSRD
ncbi:multidrug effflux MFS transporter [Bradyrhizobium sp. dw_78]|uniref:multidrug effflux MFS transporter n=1 Tax=Bradyrhizobium sp. dw_78 TaxID=2719793 RepID=UPI003208564B